MGNISAFFTKSGVGFSTSFEHFGNDGGFQGVIFFKFNSLKIKIIEIKEILKTPLYWGKQKN